MVVNGVALQLHTVYKKLYFFNTSHMRIRIRYYKSRACILNVQWNQDSYDKIIITIVSSYTRKNIIRLLPLALLLGLYVYTRNNTDSNKLVIYILHYSFVLWWYLYTCNIVCTYTTSHDTDGIIFDFYSGLPHIHNMI